MCIAARKTLSAEIVLRPVRVGATGMASHGILDLTARRSQKTIFMTIAIYISPDQLILGTTEYSAIQFYVRYHRGWGSVRAVAETHHSPMHVYRVPDS